MVIYDNAGYLVMVVNDQLFWGPIRYVICLNGSADILTKVSQVGMILLAGMV